MSMPYVRTVNEEADLLSRYSSDMDFYRRFYSIVESHPTESITVHFVAPKIQAFEDYRFYLMQNSVKRQLQPSLYYRPDYVSYQEYGTINHWSLLLFINDIPTIEDFDKEEILIPTAEAINRISTDIIKRDLLHEIVPLNELPLRPTAQLYMRKKLVPAYQKQPAPEATFVPSNLYFNREQFTLDVIAIRQRYIDLAFEPVIESLVLNVQGQPNYLYAKHYIIIKGSRGKNRLTWDAKKIQGGVGLVNNLNEGSQLEVTYARKV